VVADVTDKAAVTGMIERVERELGRIDILVNNAGINIRKPPQTLELEEWTSVIAGLDRHRSHQACGCRGQRPARAGVSGRIPTFASHSGEHLANVEIKGPLENI
jgi:NAD(P)-dependent dehydrogenase (short-subunit alcohol dehydrogenase family)